MNDPIVRFAGDRPYADSFEYVDELSVFVDLRILEKLRIRIKWLDADDMAGVSGSVDGICIQGAKENTQTDKKASADIRSSVNADLGAYGGDRDQYAVRYLQNRLRKKGLSDGQTAEKWAQQIVSRREISEAAGRSLALDIVIKKLGLPEWMTEVLIYYYSAFLDGRYAEVVGARSFYDVLCLLFEDSNVSTARISTMLGEESEAIGYLFPECDGATDILHMAPQMDLRLYELILGGAEDSAQTPPEDYGILRQLTAFRDANRLKNMPYGIHELEDVEAHTGDCADTSVYSYMLESAGRLNRRFTGSPSGTVVLWGPGGGGKHTLASCIFDSIGMHAIEYDMGECEEETAASSSISAVMDHTLYAIRECMVTDRGLVISGLERYSSEQQKLYMRWLKGKASAAIGSVCILIETETVPDYLEGVYLFGIKAPDAISRAKIWKHYLHTGMIRFLKEQDWNPSDIENVWEDHAQMHGLTEVNVIEDDLNENVAAEKNHEDRTETCKHTCELTDERVQQLANSFALTPGQIKRAAEQAFLLEEPLDETALKASSAGAEGESAAPGREDASRGEKVQTEQRCIPSLSNLYRCCYAVMGHPLKDHTQKVESPFRWDDIKMDPRDKALLRDVCDTVRNRHIVMQEWNFESKVPYGAGVTVLFAGPPGTGKTMAAQVIANELGMELYKIDLSQLIDKYVGETEKNIRNVFDQARKSNSVLFFDEADAIFNKRMDAKDANERFANIESSLLLQCIEEFDGISILATNNMTAIDNAFLRRFRYYLLFKEPDEKIRYEIWRSVYPKQAPVADEVDYHELARIFKFTGAIIKNVALTSAYLAAAQGTPIGLLEIMVAIKREMEKNHRLLTKEEMGSLGYLFAKVSER